MRAERGLGEPDRDLGDEVVAVALERLVGPDPHAKVEVARGTAPGPDRTPAAEPQHRAGVDAGGHVDLVGALLLRAALAAAGRAGRDHDLRRARRSGGRCRW